MRILSVNVSLPKIVEYKRDKVETGIFKEPVADRLMVRMIAVRLIGKADPCELRAGWTGRYWRLSARGWNSGNSNIDNQEIRR